MENTGKGPRAGHPDNRYASTPPRTGEGKYRFGMFHLSICF